MFYKFNASSTWSHNYHMLSTLAQFIVPVYILKLQQSYGNGFFDWYNLHKPLSYRMVTHKNVIIVSNCSRLNYKWATFNSRTWVPSIYKYRVHSGLYPRHKHTELYTTNMECMWGMFLPLLLAFTSMVRGDIQVIESGRPLEPSLVPGERHVTFHALMPLTRPVNGACQPWSEGYDRVAALNVS